MRIDPDSGPAAEMVRDAPDKTSFRIHFRINQHNGLIINDHRI